MYDAPEVTHIRNGAVDLAHDAAVYAADYDVRTGLADRHPEIALDLLVGQVQRRADAGKVAAAGTYLRAYSSTARAVQAERDDIARITGRACRGCGYLPPAENERVIGVCVPGSHDLALIFPEEVAS
jgi:hypothetical protein